MQRLSETIGGRERRRLQAARENGYLDRRRLSVARIAETYASWCWRLKIPLVWFERRSPRSRYGRVYLDLFTTPNVLTTGGQSAMRALGTVPGGKGQVRISPHDACWERVPLAKLDELAKAVLRAATKAGNYRQNSPECITLDARRSRKAITLVPRRAVSA